MKQLYTKLLFIQRKFFVIGLIFFLSLNSFYTKAQWVTIPDANFVNWLNANGFASCMNGNLMDTTCNAILNEDSISCHGVIADLTGIAYFKNLQFLDCSNNNGLTFLPLLPSSLITLICYGNALTTLPALPTGLKSLVCHSALLTSLPTLPNTLDSINCRDNQLTTLPALPSGLKNLICHNNLLTSLPILSNTLIYIECSNNQLTTLPSLSDSLKYLGCSGNQLTNIPALPNSLQELYCNSNSLTSLPTLPDSLVKLYCLVNMIDSFPALPNKLEHIECAGNLLTNLPSLPASLKILHCQDNQLTNLPVLPNKLSDLDVSLNILTNLPALNDSLRDLDCSWNQLTSLPPLSDSLEQLTCSGNQLSSLPNLSAELQFLWCSDNLLTYLPNLPQSLIYLGANSNQLTYLPYIPSSLCTLAVNSNQLTTIPNFPPLLKDIYVAGNLLTSLPELPDTIHTLNINDNPTLHCLPELKVIYNLYFSNTGISCIPNNGFIDFSIPSISSFSLCDTNNVNGCPVYYNIAGKVYLDSISNCIADTNETALLNIKVNLFSGGNLLEQTYSGYNGLYSFKADTGTYTYTVDTSALPLLVSCPSIGYHVSVFTISDTTDFGMDFGMQCKPGFDVGVTSVVRDSGIFRAANFARVKISAGDISNFYGLHCAAGTGGTVQVILNGAVSYFNASTGALIPVVSGDTLLYAVADFGTINFNSDFSFVVQTDTTATFGSQICFDVNVSPSAGDINTSNNSLHYCFTVVGSFDPNTKEVFPEGTIDTSQHSLTYTINFQNTGTSPAQHIYILDTLDNNLDAASFELLSYSHQPLTQITGNVARFNFPNINLPDSTNDEPHSHGYIQYRIKIKPGLASGTIIQNTAYIIFDFNVPVVTNETENPFTVDCNDLISVSYSDTSVCENEIIVASNNNGFSFPVNYEWLLDSTPYSTDSSISISGLNAGIHSIILNVTAGICTVSDTQQINVFALPSQPAINISGDTLTTVNGYSYQWFLNSGAINGAIQNNYIISQSGFYTVLITDSNGCSALSDSVYVSPLGIAEISNPAFYIYPNPVKDVLHLHIQNKKNEFLSIEFFDITGRKLETIFKEINSDSASEFSIPLVSFTKGVYTLRINDVVKKIVRE